MSEDIKAFVLDLTIVFVIGFIAGLITMGTIWVIYG